MSYDQETEFDHAVLDQIEHHPAGAVPATPAYQDALKRLYAAQQVYAHADYKGGHVTARSLARLPAFHAQNLDAFIAGKISAESLESNVNVYDRYVQSLPVSQRPAAESQRLRILGKPVHHRARHDGIVVHDPLHLLFLVPGTGPHPGLPGNYLHGSLFQHGAGGLADPWEVLVHDSDDGACRLKVPNLPEALEKLQEVLASAPFHLSELAALGFIQV